MTHIRSIDPKEISPRDLYNLLISSVAPRPIAFASTMDEHGNVNLSPYSFFNVFSANPPIMIISPTKSVRTLTHKHTYENVKSHPEVVINVVNYDLVQQMSLASAAYEKGINEFIKSGLTQVPSLKVGPPRVAESPVSFECKVNRVIELSDEGGAGNLVICEVVMMHIQEHLLDEENKLDSTKLDLVGRMGGSWYCRAFGEALFDITRPVSGLGMGVDQLPKGIRESTILTGNNLGKLGSIDILPSYDEVKEIENHPIVQDVIHKYATPSANLKDELHQLAKEILEAGEVHIALKILLFSEELYND